ncbi:ABC-2 transporter permease [Lysinibacillus sp. FSL H8-0500]|uniref:ABC-2 transporter permease n=1 Tax=Lysinibacillus sp. FSL H8-0500 TaxID=2921393 RepID=UPI00310175CE
MAGLIFKDLIIIQRQIKSQAFIVLFLLIMAIVTQQSAILLTLVVFIVTMQAMIALTYDEQSKWDRYANTLPLTKGDIVLSKYILSFLLLMIGLIIALPLVLLIHFFTQQEIITDLFLNFSLIATLALCLLAVLLPIYIHFGSIKGRFVLMAFCFMPGALVSLFKEYLPNITITLANLKQFVYITPFAGLFILWLSSLLATTIYQRKEF